MKEGESAQSCHVCGEVLDEENVSACNLCGRAFHYAWDTRSKVQNCGRLWVHETSIAIGFVCRACDETQGAAS